MIKDVGEKLADSGQPISKLLPYEMLFPALRHKVKESPSAILKPFQDVIREAKGIGKDVDDRKKVLSSLSPPFFLLP